MIIDLGGKYKGRQLAEAFKFAFTHSEHENRRWIAEETVAEYVFAQNGQPKPEITARVVWLAAQRFDFGRTWFWSQYYTWIISAKIAFVIEEVDLEETYSQIPVDIQYYKELPEEDFIIPSEDQDPQLAEYGRIFIIMCQKFCRELKKLEPKTA